MAVMLEQLAVRPGDRVLEIGAGTGYNAALMAQLAGETGEVTTIDIDQDLVEKAEIHLRAAGLPRVTVRCGDGAAGWPGGAPYDRLILTAAAADLSPAWTEQLAPAGRLVLPLSLRGVQRSVAFQRSADVLTSTSIVDCGFMPLRGALAAPDAIRQLQRGVFLKLDDERHRDAGAVRAAVRAALRQPGEQLPTGVSLTRAQGLGGLALWLALHDPDVAQLSALGAAAARGRLPALVTYPGLALSMVLLDLPALAALVRGAPTVGRANGAPPADSRAADPARAPADDRAFDVDVRGFGPAAAGVVGRLVDGVRGWEAAGRPSAATLRIRAYPRGGSGDERAAAIIDRPHTRLLLDW
jgi:protein-L-isoaspartate(D-aspartate) O-methyltransferase